MATPIARASSLASTTWSGMAGIPGSIAAGSRRWTTWRWRPWERARFRQTVESQAAVESGRAVAAQRDQQADERLLDDVVGVVDGRARAGEQRAETAGVLRVGERRQAVGIQGRASVHVGIPSRRPL